MRVLSSHMALDQLTSLGSVAFVDGTISNLAGAAQVSDTPRRRRQYQV